MAIARSISMASLTSEFGQVCDDFKRSPSFGSSGGSTLSEGNSFSRSGSGRHSLATSESTESLARSISVASIGSLDASLAGCNAPHKSCETNTAFEASMQPVSAETRPVFIIEEFIDFSDVFDEHLEHLERPGDSLFDAFCEIRPNCSPLVALSDIWTNCLTMMWQPSPSRETQTCETDFPAAPNCESEFVNKSDFDSVLVRLDALERKLAENSPRIRSPQSAKGYVVDVAL